MDNGKELAYQEEMTETFGVPVYFADPLNLWQRELKKIQMDCYSITSRSAQTSKRYHLERGAVITALNIRPIKKLNYQTEVNSMNWTMNYRS